ncbi:MAG TPA: molybdopterin-dependent oxidoreductase, partial [Blastocatellia bacterium]|nr:molybdopterin-dependent oxidoreductase [Blastocatellia bacterium]
FALIPLVIFKLMTTSWKAASYYAGRKLYKKEGPPRWYNRLLSPIMGLLFLNVLWSGVAMWGSYEGIYPLGSFYQSWAVVQWHTWSAFGLVILMLFHMLAHFRESFRNKKRKQIEDSANPETKRAIFARRAVVGGVFGAGIFVALSAAEWPWPRWSWLSKYHDGTGALDYPTVTYFGAGTKIDVSKWRLTVDGAVDKPLILSYDDILKLPTIEAQLPLQCVQGWRVERTWRGVSLKKLYEMAGAKSGFQSVTVHSASGYYFTNHAYQHLQDQALLVTHVNGEVLSDDHGFPVRILLPGLPGQNNPKWVDHLELSMNPAPRYYEPNFYPSNGPAGAQTEATQEYLAPLNSIHDK